MGTLINTIDKTERMLIPVIISNKNQKENIIDFKVKDVKICNGFLDTGATISAISNNIINELKLKPTSKSYITSILNKDLIEINTYNIWLGILLKPKFINFSLDYDENKKYSEEEWQNVKFINNPEVIKWIPIEVVGCLSINNENNTNCLIGLDVIKKGHLTISGNGFIFSI